MKRVLVTGATGFLGKYLVEELINNGYEVVAQGRKENILNNLKEQYKVNILKCSLNEIKNITELTVPILRIKV